MWIIHDDIWIIHGGTRKITECSSKFYGVNSHFSADTVKITVHTVKYVLEHIVILLVPS